MEPYAPQNGPSSGDEPRTQRVAAAFVVSGLFLVALFMVLVSIRPPSDAAVASPNPEPNTSTSTTDAAVPPPDVTAVPPPDVTVAPPSTTARVGALPQTDAKPTTGTVTFQRHARTLWQAVVDDDVSAAMPFFFPRAAYVQIKAIADPSADWQDRLVSAYRTDIHALHEQLGRDATDATFIGLHVPDGQAQWIEPGTESNSGSYWRTYGSVLRYRVNGTTHELPVTSLISWRGEWYVVHLGPIR